MDLVANTDTADAETDDQPTLIQDLDRRQNEVIAELDLLNARIESAITQWQQQDEPDIVEAARDAA